MKLTKKGQSASDIYTGVVFLFVFGLLSLIGALISITLIQNMQIVLIDDTDIQIVGNKFIAVFNIFDYITVFMLFALIIGIAVTSYRLATSRVFFLVTFVLAALYGLVAYFFSYIFGQIVSQTVFLTTTLIFPNTLLICSNLHWVSFGMIIIGSITLYAKREQGQYLS